MLFFWIKHFQGKKVLIVVAKPDLKIDRGELVTKEITELAYFYSLWNCRQWNLG